MIYLSVEEKIALVKATRYMTIADGWISDSEQEFQVDEFARLFDDDEIPIVLPAANLMSDDHMLSVFEDMEVTHCMYILGFLAKLGMVDGNVSRKEVEQWRVICKACNMRTDCVDDYISFWETH